jgi:hypothetical protein
LKNVTWPPAARLPRISAPASLAESTNSPAFAGTDLHRESHSWRQGLFFNGLLACRAVFPPRAFCVAVAAAMSTIVAQSPPQSAPAHWSYRPIVRPPLPECPDRAWCKEPLDCFVRAAQAAHGLSPAPEWDRATWLRRASLDLLGLPPSPEDVAAFVADTQDGAYGRAVDRLLADPAFGERWALWWLDLARYADSQGYEKDALRPDAWRWRDWVIAALNRDLRFDEFTIEQLAGDLLPDATLEQRVATAFHRQTMTNTEGGTDDEEFRSAAVIDRVNTTLSVWMGSTMGCAQCHDHKYDPFKQVEYYRLFAFFDQTADRDQPDESPTLRAPTAAQQARTAVIDTELAALQREIDGMASQRDEWLREQRERAKAFAAAKPTAAVWHWLGPLQAADFDSAYATAFAPERDVDLAADQDGHRWEERPAFADGVVHTWRGDRAAVYLHRTIDAAAPAKAWLALGRDDALKVWWNGESVLQKKTAGAAAPDQELVEVALREGRNEVLLKIVNGGGPSGFCFALRGTPFGGAAEAALSLEPMAGGDPERLLAAAFAQWAAAPAAQRARTAELQRERGELQGPLVPVLQELPAGQRRTTHLFLRGSFLTPGEVVTADVPACWPSLPPDAEHDRLAFARWLVASDNPLTARVQANRIWEQLFGRGLVATSEDFGKQGEPPSHPELLDWLARDFVDEGWSLKRLLRHLVLSATYRQAVAVPAELRERDPNNVWLARGPSFRLPGEILRDEALCCSGLLQRALGGPSVMPEQPAGVWTQIYSGEKWQTSAGADRHRRSLYTFWRRTSPHPAMTTFDAPSREFCVVRRVRTNTPLQALVLWNDPQFTECAAALAARAQREAGSGDDAAVLARMWQLALLRAPTAAETQRMLTFVRDEQRRGGDDASAHAWTRCASVLLSLDEFVTKG